MANKKYGLNELREMFLSFFESKGHLRLPSFPLIPQNDKSLLLINSGMAPMKPYFKGEVEPPRRRVCTCQKCIRTGDIDNIGKTSRHGTFFEMLGNFSFGDYFKDEAIPWAWEFLTSKDWIGLDPDRLYPTVYLDDDEAFDIWNKKMGIPAERIFRFGKEDNFWEHGAGPCGPCSEIYYDRGEKYGCGKPDCTVGCDCDRYIEVWNNVFSQFDNDGEGNYTPLKQKNIDTGMGLERLAVACQDVPSLFDIDTVMHITNHVTRLTGATYGQSDKMDVSLRVITDHARSAAFMICDGVLPSNEGRGYVLRRLLRNAARHGRMLGVEKPFLYEIVDSVVQVSGGQYPDLKEKKEYIKKVIHTEEDSFGKTIGEGMKIFSEVLEKTKKKGETVFAGESAFKLYDTFGFPIDITREMLEEEGMQLDEAGFRKLMDEQRDRARKAREALGDLGWAGIDFGSEIPATEFVGYDKAEVKGKVLALAVDGALFDEIISGAEAIVVLDKTVLYAEMGGQVGDTGYIRGKDFSFRVTNVQKNKGGKFMHTGILESGRMKLGDAVTSCYDAERRNAIRRAHSATHLLDSALKQVLGGHVHQAGSLVEPDRLRFDFTHFEGVTAEDIMKINDIVNEAILSDLPVVTEVLPIEEAKKKGAIAMFGEKYGETVRVVEMGDFSMEFCGGTHVKRTAQVGAFRIYSEGSIASGVRRIEAVTGKELLSCLDDQTILVYKAADVLKTTPALLMERLEATVAELREAKQNAEKLKDRIFALDAAKQLAEAKDLAGLKLVTSAEKGVDANDLRKMGDFLRDKEPTCVAVLASYTEDKVTLQAVCGKDAIAKGLKAGDIIRTVAPIIGGKGGGKPDSAMGGGKDVDKLSEALAAVEKFVTDTVK